MYVTHVGRIACGLLGALAIAGLHRECLAQPADALAGEVSSAQEGVMEGVVVSARKAGSPITVSVVTDGQGKYRFPASRMGEGRHELAIRASGYEFDGGVVDLAPGTTGVADLRLRPAQSVADQLTNAEWMASAPGPDDLKRQLLNCTDCHSVQRIFNSTHTREEFLRVFDRMAGYYPGASDLQPQRLVGNARRPPLPAGMEEKVAEYLASLDLSGRSTHPFEYRTFPRPTGRATQVVVTEYDLPRREIQPHDVVVDRDGMVWFAHFGEQFLSRLDPRTGEVKDFPTPVQRPGSPMGTLDLELDGEANLWVGLMYQTGLARFDRATGTFRVYPLPQEWLTDSTQQSHFSVAGAAMDGKIWVKNSDRSQIMRLDLATGAYENLGTQRLPVSNQPTNVYGIYADQHNDAYLLEFQFGGIGRIAARDGRLRFYPTPTVNARPRRGRVDARNRLWFAEFGGNGIGMFDPVTERITEWQMPLPWEAPYDVVADRTGEVWAVNESSDRVGRLDPRTGQTLEYLLPRPANIRRVFVDDRTTPVQIWVGNNLGAAVVKLEPLD